MTDITDQVELDTPYNKETLTLKAAAEREYVSGRMLDWYNQLPTALPWSFDDISRDFDADVYLRMLNDAQIRATVNTFKAAIVENGLQIQPAIDDKTKDGYKKAVKYCDMATEMIHEMSTSYEDWQWDMLDGIALGHRIGEMTFALDSTLSGSQQYRLDRLVVKPLRSLAFIVDPYLHVLGFMARIPGEPLGVVQGAIITNLNASNILPRTKFALLSFRPKDGDPRGTSILRPAFDPWNAKQQLKKEFLKYLSQFASPSLIGFAAPLAQPYQLKDPVSNLPLVTANGVPITRTPEDDIVDALQQFHNSTAIAMPNGSSVQVIEMAGEGKPFLSAMDHFDRQIVKAILSQTLATEEGQYQTRASSASHKDILDMLTEQAKPTVERMWERDIFRTWMLLNGFNPQLTPKASLGRGEAEDRPRQWQATANLQGAGYLHPSQLQALDRMVGLPERSVADAGMPAKELVTVQENAGTVQPVVGKTAPTSPAPQRDEQGDGTDIGLARAQREGKA